MKPYWYWIFALLIACVVSFFELARSLGRLPAVRAIGWVAFRVALDAGAAGAIYTVTADLFRQTDFYPLGTMILSGFCGPALLRAQLALLGSGQEESASGPANAFRRLQRIFDKEIREADSAAIVFWINGTVMPYLKDQDFQELKAQMSLYFGLSTKAAKASAVISKIEVLANDADASESERLQSVMHLLILNGGKRIIKTMVRSCKEAESAASRKRQEELPAAP